MIGLGLGITSVAARAYRLLLGALGLSSTNAAVGSPFSATVSGKLAGSTLSASSNDGTTLIVSGTTVSGTFAAAGSPIVTILETLAGAANSPRSSTFTISVSAVAYAPSLDFSDPRNSQYL